MFRHLKRTMKLSAIGARGKSDRVGMRITAVQHARWDCAVVEANMPDLTAWLCKLADDECDRMGIPKDTAKARR